MRQSPIDIKKAEAIPLNAPQLLQVKYQQSYFQVIDKQSTIQLEPISGANGIVFNGKPYSLAQIHFHRPSEHKIDGKTAQMECHLVHQATWEQPNRSNQEKSLLVIGVNLNTHQRIFSEAYQCALTAEASSEIELPLTELLPQETSFFSYAGSLTTPGYDERVQWVVMENPVYISSETLQEYTQRYQSNARPCHDGDCSHVFYQM